jgi:hypothetical protein
MPKVEWFKRRELGVVNLETLPAVVMGLHPGTDQPHVLVGPSLESPIGPAVCVGAGLTIHAEGFALALVAHLSPDAAFALADKIRSAAVRVAAAQKETRHVLS